MSKKSYTLVNPAERRTYWIGGQRHSIIVGGKETAGRYSIAHSTMEVGIGAAEHIHGVEAEAFYILKGTFRFRIDDVEQILEPGAFLHVEPGMPYSFEVMPPETGEVLVLYAPAGLEDFIVEVGVEDAADPTQAHDAAEASMTGSDAMKLKAVDYGLSYTGKHKI